MSHQRVHEIFEKEVRRNADEIAVEFQGKSLTYRQLNQQANQVANGLLKRGVKSGMLVGVCMNRSLEMIVGIIGILKAGAAYLPLDPSYPNERLNFMIEDGKLSIILTMLETQNLPLDTFRGQLLYMDGTESFFQREGDQHPQIEGNSDDLAYVNYTSGSTGKPKGVMLSHRGIVRLVKNQKYINFSKSEVFLQFSSISFDAATFEIWGSLLNGARLVLFPTQLSSLEELGRVIKQKSITTLWLTAGLFHQMVENHMEDLQSLRYLLAGGDVLSAVHVKKVLNAFPGIRVINGYGPTENTTFTTCYVMEEESQVGTRVPIGKPISKTQVYILNENMQPVNNGTAGELYTGGDGVALGYLNRKELTAEKFVSNPFGTQLGKLYRTGDLVRQLPNGNLEFLGRIDSQVKIRGYRIELGEVESCLRQYPGIKNVVVDAKDFGEFDKQLIAYLIYDSHHELNSNDIRSYLEKKLPIYMIPARFIQMEEFPLNENGKIDRNKFPLTNGEKKNKKSFESLTQTEKILADIWGEFLFIEDIPINERFFEMGGHSLIATRIISRVKECFGIEISIQYFFEPGTIQGLAEKIEQLIHSKTSKEELVILNVSGEDKIPLSLPQEQMLIMDQMYPNLGTYNVFNVIRLNGPLNLKALQDSFSLLVQRHQILRTIVVQEEQYWQKVQDHCDFEWEEFDFVDKHKTKQAFEEDSISIMREKAREPFNLYQGPLLRVYIFHRSTEESLLLLVLPHFVTDGWSMGIISEEISKFYDLLCESKQPNLISLKHQYADFAVWQNEKNQLNKWENQLAYWKKKLEDVPYLLELPTDFQRPKIQTYQGGTYDLPLNRELSKKIKEFAKSKNTTVYNVLLTAFQVLLARYSKQEDFLIGTHFAGRNLLEWESQIGYFVNTVVLRANLKGNNSFSELLERVNQTTIEAAANQDIRFESLVKHLRPERRLNYNPLFQVAFVLQNNNMDQWDLQNIKSEVINIDNGTSKFDLSLLVDENEGKLTGRFEYDSQLFKQETIERLAQHWKQLLTSFLLNPEIKINEISILTEEEKYQLELWNSKAIVRSPYQNVLQLFEKQVQENPHASALSFENKTLSYLELNEQVDMLAHVLMSRVSESNLLIGIYMERSIEMVVSILAVLKAGHAYVPIDPGYPEDRISYMLNDSKSAALLTTKKLKSNLSQGDWETIVVDELDERLPESIVEKVNRIIKPEDPAYVIYTSGSTGKPKGVIIPHRAILNHMIWMQNEFPMQQGDRILQKTPFSFDASIWEFFAPLLNGAELVMALPNLHTNPKELIKSIRMNSITVLQLVPTMLQLIMEEDEIRECTSLKYVFCGGEPLPLALQERFFSCMQAELINLYGPTETCIDASFWVCQRNSNQKIVPIGNAIDNMQLHVMDKYGMPVPIGVSGELWISGDGLALGYLNRPELTSEKFVLHEIQGVLCKKFYKTGDLVRRLKTGEIEYLGRIDQQVKLRGYRIELGEIENVLLGHPDIKQAVATIKNVDQEHSLVIYFVADSNRIPTVHELNSLCRNILPSYMIPNYYMQLDSLPLNPSGKVDKQALPVPKKEKKSEEAFSRPFTEREEEIRQIFSEVLKMDNIGLRDNFFEMGGHSLLAIRIISRIKERFLQDIPMHVFFEKPTIEKLAIEIKEVEDLELKMTNHEFEEEMGAFEVEELDFEGLTDEEIEEVYNLLLT
ncbi:TPA: amino acid adenylation domain-containing protein [Bacillus cereus]